MNRLWHIHPGRRREVWQKGRFFPTKVVIYWSPFSDCGLGFPANQDRQVEPWDTTLYLMVNGGWRRAND